MVMRRGCAVREADLPRWGLSAHMLNIEEIPTYKLTKLALAIYTNRRGMSTREVERGEKRKTRLLRRAFLAGDADVQCEDLALT